MMFRWWPRFAPLSQRASRCIDARCGGGGEVFNSGGGSVDEGLGRLGVACLAVVLRQCHLVDLDGGFLRELFVGGEGESDDGVSGVSGDFVGLVVVGEQSDLPVAAGERDLVGFRAGGLFDGALHECQSVGQVDGALQGGVVGRVVEADFNGALLSGLD